MWTAASLLLQILSQMMDFIQSMARRQSIEIDAKNQRKAIAYDRLAAAIAARRSARVRIEHDGLHDDGFRRK